MAKLPKVADHRQLQALGINRQHAKALAVTHNALIVQGASPRKARKVAVKRTIRAMGPGPSPAHVPGNPTSSDPRPAAVRQGNPQKLDRGIDPDKLMLGADVDPGLRQLWLSQQAPETSPAPTLDTETRERAMMMGGDDVDPELRRMFVQQLAGPAVAVPKKARSKAAPLGMDDDRFQLHTQAKALAADKIKARPGLGEFEAYTLAVHEFDRRPLAGPI